MVCPRCGIDVAENQKFCHECGAALSASPPQQPDTEPIAIEQPLVEPLLIASSPVTTTAEMPAVFDGLDDLAEYSAPRESFRLRVILILAVFATAGVLMTFVADVIDIRTTRPASGIVNTTTTLSGLGTNLGMAALVGAAVMLLGAFLACFGLRWGAGLAGGAGLALVGWAALTIGLAEVPISIARAITVSSSEQFTLRFTRDVGYWLIVGVGVVGLLVFAASLRSIAAAGRPALNPLIAAFTAAAGVILAVGPLVPVGDASFSDNFRSTDPGGAMPAAFLAGRLVQVGVIALAAMVGMLLVRSWGLGLAAGSIGVVVVLWATSLGELGDVPIGIADRNPGADNTVPHAVTNGGMVAMVALLTIAAVFATVRLMDRRSQ